MLDLLPVPGPLLLGIGLGPGNPEHLTLRALAALKGADRLVHFCKPGRRGNGRTTVDLVIGRDPQREIELAYPVTTEIPTTDPSYKTLIHAFYTAAAQRLAAELDAGRSIGVLCEGDPFFYGSFMHLWRRLAHLYPTETIPGVTAMAGCWARANTPITWGDDVLTVIPATVTEQVLADRLRSTDAAVIMKLGRHLAKVRRALGEAGMTERAIYVERGTMDGEHICPLADKLGNEAPYFSLVLVPGQGRQL